MLPRQLLQKKVPALRGEADHLVVHEGILAGYPAMTATLVLSGL